MNGLFRRALCSLAVAATLLTAGCGGATSPGRDAGRTRPAISLLNTSLVTAAGTWAVVVMGGSAASYNNFWQLFLRPTGSDAWSLDTPPGTADNGGLVVAGGDTRSLITAFRPSRYLAYTPLARTADGGRAWSAAGPLDAGLAAAPDALAAAPGTGRLLALTTRGSAEVAVPGYTTWQTIATPRFLADIPAGRACRLQALTAAAFTSAGAPLLAGSCARAGVVGIFVQGNGIWRSIGPPLPPALARQHVTVVRLTQSGGILAALLTAGTNLLAAWSSDDGSHWIVSPPLADGATLTSASFGPAGAVAVMLSGRQAKAIAGAGHGWRSLPTPPDGTATLVPGSSAGVDALAVHRSRLTVWQLRSATWSVVQVLNVPIQYGSSG
jgi:hypothetical protein